MWCSEGCSGCYEQYKCRNLIWICPRGWSGSLPSWGDIWATMWRQRVGFNEANNEGVAGGAAIVSATPPKWKTAWWESREFGRWLVMNDISCGYSHFVERETEAQGLSTQSFIPGCCLGSIIGILIQLGIRIGLYTLMCNWDGNGCSWLVRNADSQTSAQI